MSGYYILLLIASGQDDKAKSLIRVSDLKDTVDQSGTTFLHWSVDCNNRNMVDYLLDENYYIDAKNSLGFTPLMIAVNKNLTEIVKTLLEAGGDINVTNHWGLSTLQIILDADHIQDNVIQLILETLYKKCENRENTVQRLIDARCRVDQAAFLRDSWIIEYMLKQGIPIDTTHRADKRTALHIATALDDIETVRLLVKYGINVHALDSEGATAIHHVYKSKLDHNSQKQEMLQILLSQGVSPTSFTKIGNFQASPTLINGDCKAVKVILDLQMDYQAKDLLDGKTLLHYLALNHNLCLVETLKPHITKFNINAVDDYDTTPVYHAARAGNVKMLKFLLTHGAEVDCLQSINSFTPLHQSFMESKSCLRGQYDECVKLLLRHRANPQAVAYRESKSVTIFDIASEKGRIKPVIAQLALLENLGTKISTIIQNKIKSQCYSTKYLKRCHKMLKRCVAGSITVSNMLASTRRQTIQYLCHQKRLRKIKNIYYAKKLKKNFYYYYSNLKKQIARGNWFLESRETIYKVMYKLFQNKIDMSHGIFDLILDKLDDEDLKSLYVLGLDYGFLK